MEKDDGRNRYSAANKITGRDGAADFGIFVSPNSDVNWSNASQGQGEGHKIEYHLKRSRQSNIYINKITAQGASDVGMFSFNNFFGQGQGCHQFEGIFHNIRDNEITADNSSTKVGLENFGNINYKTTSTKDHGKAAGGSSSAQGQGGGGEKKPKCDGLNICCNDINIKQRGEKAYHNFSTFDCNLKTTNTEDGGSTNQSIISINRITARNVSSNVGIFNFHNVYVDWSNAGQGQGGCEGNEGILKRKGISHSIYSNTIIAVNSRKVGIQNFGNIIYNCKSSMISRLFNFLGLSY